MAQSGLGTLNEGLTDVADAKGGLVWRGDVIVDYGGKLQVNVIFGHADLFWHLNDLNLHVDLDKLLRKRVDLHETWVDGAVKATELGDQTDISLADRFVRVGADDAARDGTAATDE